MKLVFSKSGLWDKGLRIHEFEHEAPSRSGRVTMSIVSAPDHNLIVCTHHEGAESYTLLEWEYYVNDIWVERLNSPDKFEREDAENMVSITNIIKQFIANK